MLEKLGGLAVIVVTITALCLVKLLDPPTIIQLLFGLAGIFFCLTGIVFLFAEGKLLTKDRWVKMAPKVRQAIKARAS
jgi:hypothetical protein